MIMKLKNIKRKRKHKAKVVLLCLFNGFMLECINNVERTQNNVEIILVMYC